MTSTDEADPNLAWNDGHWWWWDGTEWLLATDAGWERLDGSVAAESVTAEPVTAEPAESLLIPAETFAGQPVDLFDTSSGVPGRRRVSRGFLLAIAIVAAITIGGGAWLWTSGGADPGSTTPSTATSALPTTLPDLGMTAADWNSSHTPAAGYPAGSAYDPDPMLPALPGATGAHFTHVTISGNRVVAFRLNLLAGSTFGSANFAVTRVLPTDADLLSTQILGTCAIRQFASSTLGRTIGASNPLGTISVVMRAPTVTFDMTNIAFADVTAAANPISHC